MGVINVLSKNNLKKTKVRVELLNLFSNSRSSFSVQELRAKLQSTSDKVTVYRALELFEKNGIIHRVPDKYNNLRYAFCKEQCSEQGHSHNHAHLVCDTCSDTFCIEEIVVPEIVNVQEYEVQNYDLIINGKCKHCMT